MRIRRPSNDNGGRVRTRAAAEKALMNVGSMRVADAWAWLASAG